MHGIFILPASNKKYLKNMMIGVKDGTSKDKKES